MSTSDEDDLPAPATLFARALGLASPSKSRDPTDTPTRRQPRLVKQPDEIAEARPFATPVKTRQMPPPQSRPSTGTLGPATVSSTQEVAGSDDVDEVERHRKLAEELFPPSPPASPTTALSSSGFDQPLSAPQGDSRAVAALEQDQRQCSPDLVSDSEIERERSAVRTQDANLSTSRTPQQALKSKRRTSSLRFGLSSSSDEDVLARRIERLELGLPGTEATHAHAASSEGTESRPSTPTRAVTARTGRRVTISYASSSSDSSNSEGESPAPSRKASRTPRVAAGQLSLPVYRAQEEEEMIAVCTDDDDAADTTRRLPDDVTDVDGVLIYDPTPRKRPVKMSASRLNAESPTSDYNSSRRVGTDTPGQRYSRPAGIDRGPGARGHQIAIDLTESNSEEEVLPRPSGSRLFPTPSTPPRTPARAPRLPAAPKTAPQPRTRPPAALDTPDRKLTAAQRTSLPLSLIRELDRSVFRCKWKGLRQVSSSGGEGLPDGVEVVWNKRLRNTAGRASWKSTRTTVRNVEGTPPIQTQQHRALVELSTHVTDTADKLKHTLAHELCHLAAWAISGEMKPPHGPAFKLWAHRVMVIRPDIEVTTTHSYEIAYRYRWQCVSATCGKIFGRHSNSVNPATHGCPCGARLVALGKDGAPKPAPGVDPSGAEGATAVETPRKKSKWHEFMQTESPRVRTENPGLAQSEVLKLVAARWQSAKAAKAAAAAAAPAAAEKTAVADAPPLDRVPPDEEERPVEETLAALSLSP